METTQRNIQSGDIVLLKDDDMFRRSWPLGKIVGVYPGPDGLLELQMNWCGGRETFRRSISKLVHLLRENADSNFSLEEYVWVSQGRATPINVFISVTLSPLQQQC